MRVFGMAAQLILMNGPERRELCSCSALAASSLPVPDSPVMSTVDGVSATFSMMAKMSRIDGESPTMPKRPVSETSWGFFFQAEDGIRDGRVTGVQTCALPICAFFSLDGVHPSATSHKLVANA